MTAIFSDFLGDSLEVCMDYFSIFENDFLQLSCSLDQDLGGLCQETTSVKLGEIPVME